MKERKVNLKQGESLLLKTEGEQRMNVRLYPDGSIEIWPLHSRAPEAKVLVTINAMYQRALMNRVADDKPRRIKKVKRGLLSLG